MAAEPGGLWELSYHRLRGSGVCLDYQSPLRVAESFCSPGASTSG
jgi:hypothetical protein